MHIPEKKDSSMAKIALWFARTADMELKIVPLGVGVFHHSKSEELVSKKQEYPWDIDPQRLSMGEQLGSGACGSVFRGLYNGQEVAVKVAKITGDDVDTVAAIEIFEHEVQIWSKLHHPNVTEFIGANKEKQVVMEYLPGGTLRSFIMKHQRREIPLRTVLGMGLDVARGLTYLHSKNIMHRDIKPENLLLDAGGKLKIADFGLSCEEEPEMTTRVGSLSCMAPEVLKSEPHNRKCDVYSFAICLWEMYTCNFPYDPSCLNLWEITTMVVDHKLRPRIPKSCPKELADVMVQCWAADPNQRPEMADVVAKLEDIQKKSRVGGHSLFACFRAHY